MVEALVAHGTALWLALAILAAEIVALFALGKKRGGRFLATGLMNIAAGGFLLMAVYAALAGQALAQVGLFLVIAGIAHGADTWLRWSR